VTAGLLRLWVACGSITLLEGCASGSGDYVAPYPAKWVRQQIDAYERLTTKASSQVETKALIHGKPAYLIRSPCCDRFDYFYDARGVIVCAPSGGLAGRGDGSCAEISDSPQRGTGLP
jgi:hypothetical protein